MLRPIAEPAKIGMGYSTRKQAELCLLFTRGKPKRLSKGVRHVIEAPRREHSRKPDETFTRIEALYAGPYLEMFAREGRPGWTAWGNQTDKFGRVA
jgi:N6-adenosine-specific RNA methylase IME4